MSTTPTVERALTVAVVELGLLSLLGLIVLWPSGDSNASDPALLAADPVDATVQRTEAQPCSYDTTAECVMVTISVTSGRTAGEVFTLEQSTGSGGRPLAAGDDILVLADTSPDGTTLYSFYEYERSSPMLLLLALFAVIIIAFGRWRGVGALGGRFVAGRRRHGAHPAPAARSKAGLAWSRGRRVRGAAKSSDPGGVVGR
jgi:uncharacterized membrane protein